MKLSSLMVNGDDSVYNYVSSHELARHLLTLPDVPVSNDEHGEFYIDAVYKEVATNAGSYMCIALESEIP